jgi:SAM-dependent methyltransferase
MKTPFIASSLTMCNVCSASVTLGTKKTYNYKGDAYNQYNTVGNMSADFVNYLKTVPLEYSFCPSCGFASLISPIFGPEILSREFFNKQYNHFHLLRKAEDFSTRLRIGLIRRLSGKSNLFLAIIQLLLFPVYHRLRIPRHFIPKSKLGQSFLDIGYGSGIYVDGFSRNGFDSYGIEPFAPKPAGLHGTFITDDFLMHDFAGKQFDVILLKSVLYVLADPMAYLKKVASLLKNKGNLIIMDALFDEAWLPKAQIENGVGARGRQYLYSTPKASQFIHSALGLQLVYSEPIPFDYFKVTHDVRYTPVNNILCMIVDMYYQLFTHKANLVTMIFEKAA